MSFSELFNTTGEMLYYAGIIGMIVSSVLGIFLRLWFSIAKKRIERKINSEFDKQ